MRLLWRMNRQCYLNGGHRSLWVGANSCSAFHELPRFALLLSKRLFLKEIDFRRNTN